jgi:hypothetical protein
MTEPTEKVTNGAPSDPGDEWIPRELIETEPGPLFRRFTSSRNAQAKPAEDRPANGQAKRRFKPSAPEPEPIATPPIDPLIAQRLSEVERTVARAATAADRSASKVRTIVLRNRPKGQNSH